MSISKTSIASALRTVPSKKSILGIKFILFALCLAPLARLFWLGMHDDLPTNPVEFVEHSTGFWSLFILLTSLSLTPIRLITRCAWPIQLRRMLGLFMFFYVSLHITTYLWLDYSFFWTDIINDIIKHPYVLIGFSAFILSIPLAVTSNHAMMKRLGRRWQQLHRLVYLIAILGVIHFWWLVKKDIREPLLFASVLCILLAIRIYYKVLAKRRSLAAAQAH
jgi:sulfoxide reductase heme-binding subunit YedZ